MSLKTKQLSQLLDPAFMARLDRLDVTSRKILQGKMQGERRSKRRGQSVEYADHRPYVVGDDLRYVDWNIYGRLDQLFLKLFLEEQDLTVHVAFDISRSVSIGEPSKERFIKQLAAALGYIGLVNNNRVSLSGFSDGVKTHLPNMRGRNYLSEMAECLLTTDSEGTSDFDSTCRQLSSTRTGPGLMIVLSDFFFKAGFEQGLRRLMGKKVDLYVIQILSPQEMDPQLSGDLKLIDIEDGDEAEITMSSALMKYYKKNLNAYCQELRDFCRQRDATYILANSADSVESLVLNYLRRIRLVS